MFCNWGVVVGSQHVWGICSSANTGWGGTEDLPVWVMRNGEMLHKEKEFFCGSWSNHRTFIMDRAVSSYVFFL